MPCRIQSRPGKCINSKIHKWSKDLWRDVYLCRLDSKLQLPDIYIRYRNRSANKLVFHVSSMLIIGPISDELGSHSILQKFQRVLQTNSGNLGLFDTVNDSLCIATIVVDEIHKWLQIVTNQGNVPFTDQWRVYRDQWIQSIPFEHSRYNYRIITNVNSSLHCFRESSPHLNPTFNSKQLELEPSETRYTLPNFQRGAVSLSWCPHIGFLFL